jgi:predicted DNA-binding transcriptional regulator YafY
MKNDRDKILARLSSILGKLNAGESVIVSELAEEYGVSIKTIDRDIKAFSFLPIRSDKKGCYSLEPYALGKLSYDDIKNFAVLSGAKHLFPTLSDDFIADILNEKIRSAYLVKASMHEDLSPKSENFTSITAAILQNIPMRCVYKEKLRLLYPYKFVNQHGIWYLVADDGGVLKNFSFSKITNMQIMEEERFKPKADFLETLKNPNSNWFSQTMFDVTLEISPEVSEYFLQRKIFPNQTVLQHTPSKLIVKTKVSYDEEILRSVQYWLPHITIIEPEYLQEKLVQNLQRYIKKS